MAEQDANIITEDEVILFAEKLQEWSNALPPKEQQLLHMMLTAPQAAVAEAAEVEPFSYSPYLYQVQGSIWSVSRAWSFDLVGKEAYIKDDFKHGWVNSPKLEYGGGQVM
jgi:hypothetical protein